VSKNPKKSQKTSQERRAKKNLLMNLNQDQDRQEEAEAAQEADKPRAPTFQFLSEDYREVATQELLLEILT
jgi:hypothetical protein